LLVKSPLFFHVPPLLFSLLDLLTTVLVFLRGACETNPMGWFNVVVNNTVELVGDGVDIEQMGGRARIII